VAKFSWLHLTDLHLGMCGQAHFWPNIRKAFFDDLSKLHEKCGPWDVVFFTGDFVQRGSSDEFQELNLLLEKLWKRLKELGSDPTLLAVSGNHDLSRPESKLPAVRVLAKWKDNPEIHEEFWTDDSWDYRRVIRDAFSNYVAWWSNNPFRSSAVIHRGLLPGDFSASLQYHGLRIGVVGLNTTFLQLTSGDYVGRLAWDARQFHAACGGDGVEWVRNHNVSILLTHQPPNWLDGRSRKAFSEIAPAGRFVVHLCGHMHKNDMRGESTGGGPTRNCWQGCSLFGLEQYGDEKKENRVHGYSAGFIEIDGNSGNLRHWPRLARFHQENGWEIIPDHVSCSLRQDEGTPPATVEIVGVVDAAKGIENDRDFTTSAGESNVSTTTLTQAFQMDITVGVDFSRSTPELEKSFVKAVRDLLGTGLPVRIVSKRPGSTILSIRLSPVDAERLYWAIQRGELKEWDIRECTLPVEVFESDERNIYDEVFHEAMRSYEKAL
jgi:predicted MPP superfamily phosphohydrolase